MRKNLKNIDREQVLLARRLLLPLKKGEAKKKGLEVENITQTKSLKTVVAQPSFQTLMDQILPDKLITKAHKRLLKAEIVKYDRYGNICGRVPDWNARAKGIEMAYKLKGLFKSDQVARPNPFETMSNQELESIIEGEVLESD